MPILGLTHRGANFPEIGQLRKGAEKPEAGNKPGADLNYFRFDSNDLNAVAAFQKAFGKEPREIEVLLPFPTADENFDAWREEWTAGSLKHRCDGVTCVRWLVSNPKEAEQYSTSMNHYSDKPKPCPGGCKQSGRLKVIIPALQRFAYITVMTTSVWDILTIHQNLTALELIRGNLQGIPMILRRVEREISTPNGNGARARRKKWLITIEAKPEWVQRQLIATQQAALPSVSAPLMLMPGQEDDDEPEVGTDTFDRAKVIDTINKRLAYLNKQYKIKLSDAQTRLAAASGATVGEIEDLTNDQLQAVALDLAAWFEELKAKAA